MLIINLEKKLKHRFGAQLPTK